MARVWTSDWPRPPDTFASAPPRQQFLHQVRIPAPDRNGQQRVAPSILFLDGVRLLSQHGEDFRGVSLPRGAKNRRLLHAARRRRRRLARASGRRHDNQRGDERPLSPRRVHDQSLKNGDRPDFILPRFGGHAKSAPGFGPHPRAELKA
jgi:hypothetical protein